MFTNQKGMSLPGVIVASGLVAIISLAMLSVFTDSLKAQKHIEQKYNLLYLHNEIYDLLSNTEACTATFGGTTTEFVRDNGAPGPSTDDTARPNQRIDPEAIKKSDGTDAYKVFSVASDTYENRSLKINSIRLTSYEADLPTDAYAGVGLVAIQYEKVGGSSIGATIFNKEIKVSMVIEKNSGSPEYKRLKSCIATGASGGDGFWMASTAPNSIYYSIGAVGIGTSVPTTTLDVNGGIKPGPGTAGAVCAPNPEGTMAYDYVAHHPIYCNQAGRWSAMGVSCPTTPAVYSSAGSYSLPVPSGCSRVTIRAIAGGGGGGTGCTCSGGGTGGSGGYRTGSFDVEAGSVLNIEVGVGGGPGNNCTGGGGVPGAPGGSTRISNGGTTLMNLTGGGAGTGGSVGGGTPGGYPGAGGSPAGTAGSTSSQIAGYGGGGAGGGGGSCCVGCWAPNSGSPGQSGYVQITWE